MLSIILNIITILIVSISIVLFFRVYKDQKSKTGCGGGNNEEITPSQVAKDMSKDPLIVSRSYFTEPVTGKIGTFTGQQTPSQYNWIGGKSFIPV